MFSDAKGYLITEMVWEDVTDDDEPAPARGNSGGRTSIPVPTLPKDKKTGEEPDETEEDSEKKSKGGATKGAPAAKKAKKAAPIVQQKGMMSFFGKK